MGRSVGRAIANDGLVVRGVFGRLLRLRNRRTATDRRRGPGLRTRLARSRLTHAVAVLTRSNAGKSLPARQFVTTGYANAEPADWFGRTSDWIWKTIPVSLVPMIVDHSDHRQRKWESSRQVETESASAQRNGLHRLGWALLVVFAGSAVSLYCVTGITLTAVCGMRENV